MKNIFICLFLLLAWACQKEDDKSVKSKIKRSIEPGGTEYILEKFNFGQKTRYSPDRPCLDCDLKATKLINGKQIYSVVYHIDENGFRTTPASFLPGKSKHLFLIDGSMAFSEGLNDQQSLIDLINRRSSVYKAYDLGFLGNGPQHSWALFHSGVLREKVLEDKGVAVLISHDQDIRRFLVTTDHLIYSAKFPNVIRKSSGEFENKGPLETSGSFVQRALINYCVPFLACKNLMTKSYKLPDESEVIEAAALFTDIEKMYRAQFKAEKMVILWTGSDVVFEMLKKQTHIPLIKVSYERFDANHATAKGAEQIVDTLFKELQLN